MTKGAPRSDYLDVQSIDDLARIVTALVQETWVMRDRMAVTEALLEQKTGITGADIDDYVADAGAKVRIEALRDRFVAKVVGAPLAARERSVEQILSRAGLARPGFPS